MATRSRIGMETPKGIISVYCHNDGYISCNGYGVGENLVEHFKTHSAVEALLKGGEMSSLGASVNETNYYKEPFVEFISKDRKEYIEDAQDCGAEFIYLFSGNEWLVAWDLESEFFPVVDLLDKEPDVDEKPAPAATHRIRHSFQQWLSEQPNGSRRGRFGPIHLA